MSEEVKRGQAESGHVESIQCKLCESGEMRRAIIKPYNLNVGIAMLVAGAACLVTGILSLLGLIAILAGGYFVLARKDVWLCDKCKAIVERL